MPSHRQIRVLIDELGLLDAWKVAVSKSVAYGLTAAGHRDDDGGRTALEGEGEGGRPGVYRSRNLSPPDDLTELHFFVIPLWTERIIFTVAEGLVQMRVLPCQTLKFRY